MTVAGLDDESNVLVQVTVTISVAAAPNFNQVETARRAVERSIARFRSDFDRVRNAPSPRAPSPASSPTNAADSDDSDVRNGTSSDTGDTATDSTGAVSLGQLICEDDDFVGSEREMSDCQAGRMETSVTPPSRENRLQCVQDNTGRVVCHETSAVPKAMQQTGPPVEIAYVVVGCFAALGLFCYCNQDSAATRKERVKTFNLEQNSDGYGDGRESIVYETEGDNYATGTISRFKFDE